MNKLGQSRYSSETSTCKSESESNDMIILSYVVLNASINPSPGSPKMTSTFQSSRASATISAIKDPNNIKVILLTYTNTVDSSQITKEG
ncbi:MAG: hypothetical protein WAZ77_13755 [Candidatus Nitrosopolaris sp.]